MWLWYLSVTLLAFMTVFLLIRFVLFLVLWVCGYEFWILPNLFDDTLSFSDSFKPRYSNEKVPAGQHWYRIAVFAGFVGFFYWAYTQPTDFDEMVNIQKQFMADLCVVVVVVAPFEPHARRRTSNAPIEPPPHHRPKRALVAPVSAGRRRTSKPSSCPPVWSACRAPERTRGWWGGWEQSAAAVNVARACTASLVITPKFCSSP